MYWCGRYVQHRRRQYGLLFERNVHRAALYKQVSKLLMFPSLCFHIYRAVTSAFAAQAKAFMPASITRLSKITIPIAGLNPQGAGLPTHNMISPVTGTRGEERGGDRGKAHKQKGMERKRRMTILTGRWWMERTNNKLAEVGGWMGGGEKCRERAQKRRKLATVFFFFFLFKYIPSF